MTAIRTKCLCFVILCLCLCLPWVVMISPAQEGDEDDMQIIIAPAEVESITVTVFEGDPVQVSVDVRGNLSDGCTTLGEFEQRIRGYQIDITLYTQRPAMMFCTQILTPYITSLPLETDDLPPGDYTLSVNGVTTTFSLGQGMTPDSEAYCPPSSPGRFIFHNAARAYCLQTPVDAVVSGRYPDLVLVQASRQSYPDVRPELMISTTDAQGRSLDDVIADLQSRYEDLQSTEITLHQQHRAFIVEGLPGRFANRQLFFVIEERDTLYRVIAQPIAPDMMPEQIATEMLWLILLESLRFAPLDAESQAAPRAAPQTQPFDGPGFRLTLPVDWEAHPLAADAYGFFPMGGDAPLLTVGVLDESPQFTAALLSAPDEDLPLLLYQYYSQLGEAAHYFDFERQALNPLFDAVLYGLGGLCQQGIIRDAARGQVWRVNVAAQACGAPNSIMITHPGVLQMVESISLVDDA